MRTKSFPVPAGIIPKFTPLLKIPLNVSNTVPSPPTAIISV
jgi:hypothetical protein